MTTATTVVGEEFMMILPHTGIDGTLVLAERLRQAVEQTVISCNDLTLKPTLSLGFPS